MPGAYSQTEAGEQSPAAPASLSRVALELHVPNKADPAPNPALAAVPRVLNLSGSGLLVGFLSAASSMALLLWAFVRLWLFAP